MKIPKRFKLFGTTYNIVWDNKRANDLSVYGQVDYANCEILLSTSFGLTDLTDERKTDVFYHEKVHAILYEMSEHELNKNEQFVDTFAKLWKQADDTAEY